MKKGQTIREIDFEQFEKLLRYMPTASEVAGFFRMSEDTLNRRLKRQYNKTFSELLEQFTGDSKIKLRGIVWRHARKSPAVAIFLAKNYLGMSDSPNAEMIQVDGLKIIEE